MGRSRTPTGPFAFGVAAMRRGTDASPAPPRDRNTAVSTFLPMNQWRQFAQLAWIRISGYCLHYLNNMSN